MFRLEPHLRYIFSNLTIYGDEYRGFLIDTTYNSDNKLKEIFKNYTLKNTTCFFDDCYFTNTFANTIFNST